MSNPEDTRADSRPAADRPLEALALRNPRVPPGQLVAELVPPPRFSDVRFASYVPAPDQPTQAQAVEGMSAFGERVLAGGAKPGGLAGLFKRKAAPAGEPGIYLDGGFGVGKTHLLSSLYH